MFLIQLHQIILYPETPIGDGLAYLTKTLNTILNIQFTPENIRAVAK